jgi:uncharacterized protein
VLNVAPFELDSPGITLRARMTGFAGFLRTNGFGVAGGDAARVVATAAQIGILEGDVLRWSLKALLCGRGEEWRRFDALFDAYFLPPNKRTFTEGRAARSGPAAAASADPDARRELPVAGAEGGVKADDDAAERHGASPEAALAATDFRDLHQAEQVRGIEALMRRFARRLRHLRLRRETRSAHGQRLDFAGTIRRSVASGGTPIHLAWKDRRRVRPRLVLLLDVSRSMSQYSFFYLRLARALCAELTDVHCFIFHTHITSVGEALRDPDPWRSQERLHLLAAGWGGGTRIGECLTDFNRRDGARLVHSRSAVIVVSDGYDTGDPEMLAAALRVVRRRARRVAWLNPLLRQADYRPESRDMRAALPYLDLFAPGADLASIERILPALIEALR